MAEVIKNAIRDVEVARNHFNHCDKNYIDASIHQLTAAEAKLNALLIEEKQKAA